jgi:subtilisin family serine protease
MKKNGRAPADEMPATPGKRQWYLRSQKTGETIRGADINAPGAWKVTRGDRKIVVAIIDGGFDLEHPDLNLPGKIVFPKNYITKKQNADSFHGTMCAGVALAENSKAMLGIANGCSFMPVCIPANATQDLMVKVFKETARHADVISCSWAPPPVYAPLSAKLFNVLKEITEKGGPRKKGCVICFSASNYNAPLNDPHNQQFLWLDKQTDSFKITRGPILNGYAVHPGVIAVAASTSLNQKATYSNWGNEISVCAPSNNYHPLVEGGHAKGRSETWTTKSRLYNEKNKNKTSHYTKDFGGTSFSTALVAGVAALVLSANNNLNAAQVKKILQDSADKIEDPEPGPVLGNKKGTYINGHSAWFGFGKVNAGEAVRLAKNKYDHMKHSL